MGQEENEKKTKKEKKDEKVIFASHPHAAQTATQVQRWWTILQVFSVSLNDPPTAQHHPERERQRRRVGKGRLMVTLDCFTF